MKRLRIDRLDLDLRGVTSGRAHAAAESLGPALARALSGRALEGASHEALDAGSVQAAHGGTSAQLSQTIARALAGRLTKAGP